MAQPVNPQPILPAKTGLRDLASLDQFDRDLLNNLTNELRAHAFRLNIALMNDGSEPTQGPVVLTSYLKTALPSASAFVGGVIYVSNETGGATVAFSDGTNWRRVQDRNVVS